MPTDLTTWRKFWHTYLKSNAYDESGAVTEQTEPTIYGGLSLSGGTNSEFYDPRGYNYLVDGSYAADENGAKANKFSGNEDWQWMDDPASDASRGYVVHVYQKSNCDGDVATEAMSERVVAFRYRLEGSGYYCGDNL